MNKTVALYLIISTVVFSACSSVKLTGRNEKDSVLNSNNYNQLKGRYSNISLDTIQYNHTLIGNFQFDTLFKQKEISFVTIEPIDDRTLNLKLFKSDSNICALTITGKYQNGYFKVKRQWNTSFIAGPLLWVLGENLKYIGLTKENNLVVANSGGSGVLLLTALPLFVAGGGHYENEYQRIK